MGEDLHITDLIDLDILQNMQDSFCKLYGFPAIISDRNGVPVTQPSVSFDFCRDCVQTTRPGQECRKKCTRLGMEQAVKVNGPSTYICNGGLLYYTSPIVVNNTFMGTLTGGQILTQPMSQEQIEQYAKKWEIDPLFFSEQLKKVPIISEEELKNIAGFLYSITNGISSLAYNRYLVYQASQKIEQAAHMKSDFLANMSHEIRTPMNAVIGMAEMALRENLPPAARNYINQIKSSGKTLLSIINDILDFSKIESGKMDINFIEYSPMSIINDVANIINTRIGGEDIELILDISPDIPTELLGDNVRLKQIIINLSNNAVKFTQRGQVLLKMFARKKNENEIDLCVAVADTGIGIKKQDFPNLFHSFEQLDSKRNRNIEGTGLGLAISKKLLNLMYGDIQVKSEYGKGSIFSFSIPQRIVNENPAIKVANSSNLKTAALLKNIYVKRQLKLDIERLGISYNELHSEEDLLALTEQNVTHIFVEHYLFSEKIEQFFLVHPKITGVVMLDFFSEMQSNVPNLMIVKKPLYSLNLAMIFNHEDLYSGYNYSTDEDFEFIAPEAKILIVDDNKINLTVVEGLLEPLKMNIKTALSGREAIDMISKEKYDLIFMDHMMPELDGVETTHIIRRFHKEYDNVPIIALTANAIEGTKNMFLEEGMNDFVTKPIELRILVSKLKRWLPRERIQKVQSKQQETRTSSLKIEALDTDYALSMLGNEKLFWAVLKDYYRAIKKKAELIKRYEENEDWHNYTVEVHSLKSSSRQVGATELAKKAEQMEKAGNEENAALIRQYTSQMLEEYKQYLTILEPYFKEEQKSDYRKEEISAGLLKNYFSNMRIAFENLDMDQMEDVIKQMEQYRYYGQQKELFEQLQSAVEAIDVELCESIIQTWEKDLSHA